jgi:nucleoside-diphosphate-sugar epimerase
LKVLVTGHEGYIGSVLVGKLLGRGHFVRGLDTEFFRECELTSPPEPSELIRKDVRDVTVDDVAGVEAVIHLAALSNDPMGEIDPALTLAINYEASVNVARLAKQAGVRRYLFASSCSMYGQSSAGAVDETAGFNPLTAYAQSKVKTEEAVSRLADDAFSPTFLRNATAYGLSPRLRFDLVLNNLIGWAMTTGEAKVMSDGSPWRPLVHCEDIADAFIAALEAPLETVHNQAFNIGQDSENYQVRDIAEAVAATVPGCRVTYAEGAGPDPRSYRVDFSKVRRVLPSFQPRWNVRLGAQQLYNALKDRRVTREDFEGRRFVRLAQLKHLLANGSLQPDLRWSSGVPTAAQ